MTPTLPGLPSDDATSELQDAAKGIVNITAHGDGFLVTMADGQELMLRPGDAHTVGPLDRNTTFDAQDGEGPQNLHELYHSGELPARLHQMIAKPAEPTAAEAGLVALPDLGQSAPPGGPLGGMPTPDEGSPDEEAADAEDQADGGADEAQEGEAPEAPAKKPAPKGKAPAKVTLPGL